MWWADLKWLEDAELLGRLGRKALAAILKLLAPFLVRQKITLPDPDLRDPRYFDELAGLFRSQPIKVTVYLPPFLAESSPAQARPPAAQDTPPPAESASENRSLAAKVFELLTALDPDNRLRKAPPIKVFNLYYRQGLRPAEIARKCDCDRSLVHDRLAAIQAKIRWTPTQLREVSPHVEAMQEALTDSRAEGIYRKGAVYGEEDDNSGDE
jgi:hypothetical protein